MARMSSPNGDEVLTVNSKAGADVLRSLGWSEEGESSAPRAEPATSEQPRRKPGRPRKNPPETAEPSESTEESG